MCLPTMPQHAYHGVLRQCGARGLSTHGSSTTARPSPCVRRVIVRIVVAGVARLPSTRDESGAGRLSPCGVRSHLCAVSVHRSTAHPTGTSNASVLASAASAHSYPGIAPWVRPTDLCDRLAGPSTWTCGARTCPAQTEARGMTDLAPPHRPTHTHARRME